MNDAGLAGGGCRLAMSKPYRNVWVSAQYTRLAAEVRTERMEGTTKNMEGKATPPAMATPPIPVLAKTRTVDCPVIHPCPAPLVTFQPDVKTH